MFSSSIGADSVPNNGPKVLVSVFSLNSIAGLFLALRLYAKTRGGKGVRNWWWDEYLLCSAFFFMILQCVVTIISVRLGFGKHMYDLDIESLSQIMMLSLIASAIHCISSSLVKVAFALTLLRVAIDADFRWMRLVLYWCIVSTAILLPIAGLLPWVMCTPVEKFWRPWLDGECGDFRAVLDYGVFASVYTGVIDFVLACLPWWIVPMLQLGMREKIAVGAAMSMGIFGAGCAFFKSAHVLTYLSSDFTYDGFILVFWGVAEPAITLVGSTVPALRVLLRDAKRSWVGQSTSTGHSRSIRKPLNSIGITTDEEKNNQTLVISSCDVTEEDNPTSPKSTYRYDRNVVEMGLSEVGSMPRTPTTPYDMV